MNIIETKTKLNRTIIRVTKHALYVLTQWDHDQIAMESQVLKSRMSIAANLRESFRESEILQQVCANAGSKALVLIDNPVLFVPIDEFEESQQSALFNFTYPGRENEIVMNQTVGELNCVAVFSVNKDLKMVIDDNFEDSRIMPLTLPVWSHLHVRSFTGMQKKLFAYFHDDKMELVSFANKRIKYSNTFEISTAQDSAYYLMYVFQQLAMNQKKDELYIVGDIPGDTKDTLKRWVRNVFDIYPSAEYNRHPLAGANGMKYDIITYALDNV